MEYLNINNNLGKGAIFYGKIEPKRFLQRYGYDSFEEIEYSWERKELFGKYNSLEPVIRLVDWHSKKIGNGFGVFIINKIFDLANDIGVDRFKIVLPSEMADKILSHYVEAGVLSNIGNNVYGLLKRPKMKTMTEKFGLVNTYNKLLVERILKEDDSDEDEMIQKIMNLLWSGDQTNIDLALGLAKHLDQRKVQNSFEGQFLFPCEKLKLDYWANNAASSYKYFSYYKFVNKVSLDLEHTGFGDDLDSPILYNALSKFVGVKRILLYDANLKKIPNFVTKHQLLESLDLGTNNIESINEITALKNLKYLIISPNPIKSLPDNIGNLQELEQVTFNDTPIQDIPESFYNLKYIDSIMFPDTLSKYHYDKLFETFGKSVFNDNFLSNFQ